MRCINYEFFGKNRQKDLLLKCRCEGYLCAAHFSRCDGGLVLGPMPCDKLTGIQARNSPFILQCLQVAVYNLTNLPSASRDIASPGHSSSYRPSPAIGRVVFITSPASCACHATHNLGMGRRKVVV